MVEELWRYVPGYENLYQVSTLGRVRSLDKEVDVCYIGGNPFKRKTKGRILKPYAYSGGFLTITLYKEGIPETYLIHRLVANTFLENPKRYKMISFIDGNRHNLNLNNLRWGRKG